MALVGLLQHPGVLRCTFVDVAAPKDEDNEEQVRELFLAGCADRVLFEHLPQRLHVGALHLLHLFWKQALQVVELIDDLMPVFCGIQ